MTVLLKNLKVSIFLASLFILTSCEFSFSTGSEKKLVQNDIAEKLSTQKNELDYKEVRISGGSNEKKIPEFMYGEKITFEFLNVSGFTEENDLVYPGLQVLVLGKNKDTITYNPDLYANKSEGLENSDLNLSTWLTLGNPMHSKNNYDIFLHFWDKKGEGTIDSSLELSVVPNPKIKVKNSDLTFDEIYLYSDKRGVLTDDKIVVNENIHFVFEGLDGLQVNNKKVSFGVSLEAQNSFGAEVIKEDDLFKDTKEADVSELKKGLSPYIFFDEKEEEGSVKIKCKVKVWDKKSNRSMTVYTNLTLVDEIEW